MLTKIAKRINDELSREATDLQTWQACQQFWAIDEELPQAVLLPLLDRVELLESKMYEQHGWKR